VLSVVSSLREQGTTIVWITQLLEEVTWADRIIGLADNGIGYDGDAQSFFYTNDLLEGDSACERLGFQPPYVIQVAKRLHAQGHRLIAYPLTTSELREAVMALCR
jgi:ABC-type multidrug transport system ATPase subunit